MSRPRGELLERGAQLRPLPAQPLANRRQPRARVVEHLAVHVDGVAHGRHLLRKRREAADQALQDREAARRAVDRRLRLGNRRHEVGQDAQLQRLERRGPRPAGDERGVETGAGAQREDRRAARRSATVSLVAASACATTARSVCGSSARMRVLPTGVSAKLASASMMRSNSSVRRRAEMTGVLGSWGLGSRACHCHATETVFLPKGNDSSLQRTTARPSPQPPVPSPPVVDQRRHVPRPEAVVDVDDGDAGGARVEHAEQRARGRRSWRRSRRWSARRSPGASTSPPTTLGSAPSMPATTTRTSRAAQQRSRSVEQAVDAGDADVVDARRRRCP